MCQLKSVLVFNVYIYKALFGRNARAKERREETQRVAPYTSGQEVLSCETKHQSIQCINDLINIKYPRRQDILHIYSYDKRRARVQLMMKNST